MKIEIVGINTIVPYQNNAKQHPKEQIERIKASIVEFGNNDPIAIDNDNVVIEGHGRLMALKELGYTEVEVIRLGHLTEEQRNAYILVHNQLTLDTGFDIDILNLELENIIDIDMEKYGFDIHFDLPEETIIEDEFDESVPIEPRSKLGDLYQLGRHRLLCGDSTKVENVQKLMGGEEADMYLSDPPYNVAYVGKTDEKLEIQNDSMSNDDFRQFLTSAFYSVDTVLKKGGAFYIWHANTEAYHFLGAASDINWVVRQVLVWNKNTMVLGRQDYHWKHEPCLYGWKGGAGHFWNSDRKQTTILEFDRPQRNAEHPTMKPVALFDYQIQNNSRKGENILDTFGGSGTTLIACEQNDRTAYVMELDPRYVDVIINRFESLTGQKAVKIDEAAE